MFKKLLVAVDTAEPELAAPALAAAAEFAKAGDADVRIVHVRYMIEAAVDYLPKKFFEEEEKRTLADLADLARPMGLRPAQLSTVTPIGTVYDQVLSEAAEYNADLIVVGSHRPSMSTYLLGSNAARIVRHAKCSVLVVR